MWNSNRIWAVAPVETAQELAKKLTGMQWCRCAGFELDGYLFLNDSTGPDGAQEYGVFKKADLSRQLESIAFSWCSEAEALRYIQEALAGEYDGNDWRGILPDQTEPAEGHDCPLCA